jgi:hypothetical protein
MLLVAKISLTLKANVVVPFMNLISWSKSFPFSALKCSRQNSAGCAEVVAKTNGRGRNGQKDCKPDRPKVARDTFPPRKSTHVGHGRQHEVVQLRAGRGECHGVHLALPRIPTPGPDF